MDNKFGIDELVDTAADIMDTAQIIGDAVSDGFQITDVAALFAIAPKAVEIKNDWRRALDELLDLNADEAQEAAARIADRTGHPANGIIARVNEAFELTARTYGQVKQVTYLAQSWARWGRSLANHAAAA